MNGRAGAAALLFLGVATLLLASWLNRPSAWRPAVLPDIREAGTSGFAARAGERYEVVLELADDQPREALEALALPRREQNVVAGRWRLGCADGSAGTGAARDYLRTTSARTLPGKIRRIATRSPFPQDEASFRTLGLAGTFLVERAVGAFTARAAGDCELSWQPEAVSVPARLSVQRARADWLDWHRVSGTIATAGWLLVLLAAPLWWAARRRVSVRSAG